MYRIPRHTMQSVDLDDYIQLQLLLQQERERREAAIDRRLLEERQRLEEAMVRLHYIEQQRKQQRLEEERRLQRERRYRAELLAALGSTQEEDYRLRVLAALERQKQWETTRLQHEESKQKQRGTSVREDESRRQALESLLKHVFGQQLEQDDEQYHKLAVPELAEDENAAWEKYYRPEPRCLSPSSHRIPIIFVDESSQKQKQKQQQQQQQQRKPQELKEYVVPLKSTLEALLTKPVEQERKQTGELESAARPQTVENLIKDAADSAEARHQHQKVKQEEDRQQRLVEDRAFEAFLNQIFPQQEQQPSTSPAKPAPAPVPKLSEDEAAAKIQAWYKSAHDSHAISQVTHQLTALNEISSQLDRTQSDCEQSILADPTASSGTDQDSPIATRNSRRWLQYEDEVMKMLVRLDTIESHGSDLIRERRKQLVKKASALLDRLDEYKQAELERSSSSSQSDDNDKARILETSSEPDVQPKASEPSVSSIPNYIPGHPHPENPNATTVDDEDNSMDVQLEVSEPTVGGDTAVETAQPIVASSTAESMLPKDGSAREVDGKEGKGTSEEEFVVV